MNHMFYDTSVICRRATQQFQVGHSMQSGQTRDKSTIKLNQIMKTLRNDETPLERQTFLIII